MNKKDIKTIKHARNELSTHLDADQQGSAAKRHCLSAMEPYAFRIIYGKPCDSNWYGKPGPTLFCQKTRINNILRRIMASPTIHLLNRQSLSYTGPPCYNLSVHVTNSVS